MASLLSRDPPVPSSPPPQLWLSAAPSPPQPLPLPPDPSAGHVGDQPQDQRRGGPAQQAVASVLNPPLSGAAGRGAGPAPPLPPPPASEALQASDGGVERSVKSAAEPGRGGEREQEAAEAVRHGETRARTSSRTGARPACCARVWGCGAMLKSCGKKLLLSLLGSTLTCCLVLVVDPQRRQGLSWGGGGGEFLRPFGGPRGGEARGLLRGGAADGAAAGQSLPEAKRFTDYFAKLSRGKRDALSGGGGGGAEGGQPPQRPRLEEISPRDVFIAVKTTKNFHRSRMELLLDTWISRNKDIVRRGARVLGWGGSGVRGSGYFSPPPK